MWRNSSYTSFVQNETLWPRSLSLLTIECLWCLWYVVGVEIPRGGSCLRSFHDHFPLFTDDRPIPRHRNFKVRHGDVLSFFPNRVQSVPRTKQISTNRFIDRSWKYIRDSREVLYFLESTLFFQVVGTNLMQREFPKTNI